MKKGGNDMRKITVLLVILLFGFGVSLSFAETKDDQNAMHLLGKIESNLWESASAVYFHIADHARGDQRIALDDYKDDLKDMSRCIDKIQGLDLTYEATQAILKIESDWQKITVISNELIKSDVAKEAGTIISESKMHHLWVAVEALDHLIDEEIVALLK